jgi:hypothetical protein
VDRREQTPAPRSSHRLRPRYGSLAVAAGGLGLVLVLLGLGFSTGASRIFATITGFAGIALALAWLLSPVRQLRIVTSPAGLAIARGAETRLEIGWDEVERLLLGEGSAYLWAGSQERSLLVAGPGVPAPYAVEDREGLVAAMEAAVGEERIERTDDLLAAYRELGREEEEAGE